MKRFLVIALMGTVGLFYAGTASAATGTVSVADGADKIAGYVTGMAANGIGMSRHNFGGFGEHVMAGTATDGSGPITAGQAVRGTTEICVFCHTPHHSKPAAGPLWNRGRLSDTYIAYGETICGTTPSLTLNPESAACLSCHDGISTFDMLVNSPGKGFTKNTLGDGHSTTGTYNSGSNAGFAVRDQDWFFTEKAVGTGGFGANSRLSIGAGVDGSIIGTTADLSNDHPIGITYSGGSETSVNPNAKASLRPSDTVIANIDLRQDLTNGNAIYDSATFDNANLTQNKWALYGFINDTATIGQLLKGAGTVECGSCHDPHFSNKSWGEYYGNPSSLLMGSGGEGTFKSGAGDLADSDGLFLRRVGGNTGSGLCRTCHNK